MTQLVGIDNNFVYVKTPYDLRDYVRDALNGVWLKSKGGYRFPRNYHALRELAKNFPMLLTNQEFIQMGKRLNQARQGALQLKTASDAPGDVRLRPYQRADVAYLKRLPSAGIFNEPRTGKTPTSIILMKELGTKRNLVICPASLVLNWAKEVATWWEGCLPVSVSGTPTKRYVQYSFFKEKSELGLTCILIISKDTWKADFEQWRDYEFETCFVDEAHFLRNMDTAQSKAIYATKAARRYALTGTPTVKHPKDIFGILKFLYPEKFPSQYQFNDRYFHKMQNEWSGGFDYGTVREERREELQEMIAFMSTDRKRKEVMQWLPAKEFQTIPVEMTGKQAKLYERMESEFMAYLDGDDETDTVIDTPNALVQLIRLRQLCIDPALLGFDVDSAKTKAILEWLDDNREPVLIMSMFTSYLHLLKPQIEKLGLKVGVLTGEQSTVEKQRAATDFQSGRSDILLCNIISAGVGWTLDRAEVAIFPDKPWNPADAEQAESRILPVTQDRWHPCAILSFTCIGSVDERIDRILQNKTDLTNVVNHGGKEALKRLLGM